MTPEERRRMRLARTGPLSGGPIVSDKAWYEIPPAMTNRLISRHSTPEDYRVGRDPETGGLIEPYRDQTVIDYLRSKRFPDAQRSFSDDPLAQPTPLAQPVAKLSELSTFPDRNAVTYEDFDVQEYGQQKADEFRTFMAKSQQERDAILDAEYDKTRRLANLASAFGVNVNLPQRKSSASSADPAAGIAEAQSMEKFKQILYDNPPKTKAEAYALSAATNASKKELEFLNKIFPKLDLGKQVPMYRVNNGEIETIWRYENAPLENERAAGFTLKFDVATMGKADVSEANQARLSSLALEANINTEEDYKNFINGLSAQDKKLVTTNPAILSAIHKFVPDSVLKSTGKTGLWTRGEDGRAKIVYFDPASDEFQKQLDSGDYFKTLEELNANKTFDLNSFIVDLLNSPNLIAPNFEDLTDPEKRVLILDRASKAGVNATTNEILEAFDKAVDIEARTNQKYVDDVNILNNKMNDFDSWKNFYSHIADKNYNEKAVSETVSKLQDRYGDTWKFTPVMMYNDAGEEMWVTSGSGLQLAHENKFVHSNYNDAPNRPLPKISDRYWAEEQPSTDRATIILDDGKTLEVYTDTGKHNRITDTRSDIARSVTDFEAFEQRINMITSQLKKGQPSTDLQAIRDLEKLKDDSGVIRESDVQMIKQSIGSYEDRLERLIEHLKGGPDRYLTQDERDQVALAALTTLEVLKSSMANVINTQKLRYEWDKTKTWNSKGEDRISFFEVIPEVEYSKYVKPFDWQQQEHWVFQDDLVIGGVSIDPTPDERKDDIQLLLPGISSTLELVP